MALTKKQPEMRQKSTCEVEKVEKFALIKNTYIVARVHQQNKKDAIMFKIVDINGTRQLANVAEGKAVKIATHNEINEMLALGVVSEEVVEQWAAFYTDMDVEVSLTESEIQKLAKPRTLEH